jgi:LacI family transcriptional regulator
MPPVLTEPNPLPKYLDLCRRVEEQIESGDLRPGDRLPSFVQMREQYGATTATVERILRTLESKGLVRREASRGTFVTARARVQNKGVIGILTQMEYRQHPYYVSILNGVQEEAHRLGLEVWLLPERSVVNRDKVDGLLVAGVYDADLINLIKQIPLSMPRVALMTTLPEGPRVVADDRQGITLAVEHLVELGHRRIAFLTSGHYIYTDDASRQRLEAYRETLLRHGIEPDPRWTRDLRGDGGLGAFRGFAVYGREKMQEWLEDDWDELGCTALLAQNDEVAIPAIQVLQEAGYNVPEQVSVIGFDDAVACAWIRPHLTTVKIELEQVGAHAVRLLLEQTAEVGGRRQRQEANVVTLPVKLVVRESTGPAPQRES